MKKTLITITLIFVLAISAMGFAACEKDKIDENTDISEVKSEKIADAAAWDAAFAEDKFANFSIKLTSVSKIGGAKSIEETICYNFTGDKAYFKGITKDGEETNGIVVYASKTAEEFKTYSWGIENGKDGKGTLLIGETAKQHGGDVYATGKYGYDVLTSIKNIKFENVKYNDEEKGYVYENSESGNVVKAVIKFADGKFAGYTNESSSGDGEEKITTTGNLVVYNVGKTAVDLPEAMTAAHSHSFGEEWKSDETNHWYECGCGEKKDSAAHTWNDGEIITPAQIGVKGEKTFTCTVCGKIKTEEIPALSAEEMWKNAFDNSKMTNYTMRYTKGTDEGVYKCAFTESGDHVVNSVIHQETYNSESYAVKTVDGKYISYKNRAGVWQKSEMTASELGEQAEIFDKWQLSYAFSCPNFGEAFAKFTYDENSQSYIFDGKDGENEIEANSIWEVATKKYYKATVKLDEQGRLEKVEFTMSGSAVAGIVVFDAYGTTEIVLPSVD